MAKRVKATGLVEIVKLPAGSGIPEWVRMAWIGLTLPCFPVAGLPGFRQEKGALSGKPAEDGRSRQCAVVPQDQALRILRESNPEAADWWKSRGFPRKRGDKHFCFSIYEVKFVSGVRYQRLEQFLGILEVGC